ncbi:MAG TPA: hypothetical protein VNO83_01140 [Pseudonocardia sp.]|jgi:hypothetical protein|nr:hypothetical protein [Pseudonocardia sp.]
MTVRCRRGVRERAPGWVGALAVLAVLAGCGAPEYTYVTNSADRTYLRIPHSWQPIDERALGEAIGLDPTEDGEQSGFWLEGYDADAAPSPDHLLGQHSPAPAVFIGVRDVPELARGQISLDLLRDLFRPVSAAAREEAELNPMSPFSGFSLISDEVLTPGDGLRGVHVVYKYRISGGPSQVFDQIAYVNDDASKLYMFYVRCSTECYDQRKQEIANVVSSFTVRETA